VGRHFEQAADRAAELNGLTARFTAAPLDSLPADFPPTFRKICLFTSIYREYFYI
jgi:hypothetical protein